MVNLHGKLFSVGDALRRFDRVERLDDPEDIKQAIPWVRESTDPETGPALRRRRARAHGARRGHALRDGHP